MSKIKPYINRLNNSKEYKNFEKKHKDAFMIAGFFILDLETQNNLHQIDYYVPQEKKIAAFTIDKGVVMQMLDMMNNKLVPEKLDMQTNIDLDALPGILEDEMKNRNITADIKKIIAIVQTIEGKKIWNLSCVLSGMNILKAHVDDSSKTVLKMEKSSIMDYISKIPGGMPGMPGQKPQAGQLGQGTQAIQIPGMPQTQETNQEETEEPQQSKGKVTLQETAGVIDTEQKKKQKAREIDNKISEKLENLDKLEKEIALEKEKIEVEEKELEEGKKELKGKKEAKKKAKLKK